MNAVIPEQVFKDGILNEDYHKMLIQDLDNVVTTAGIPRKMLWSRMSDYCAPEDIEWVKKLRTRVDNGLCYVGSDIADTISDRMMAITGACLRNYMDARVMTVQDILAHLKAGDMSSPRVLLIPNLCTAAGESGSTPEWEVSAIVGVLRKRFSQDLKTVVYVCSMDALRKQYGSSLVHHVKTHYTII